MQKILSGSARGRSLKTLPDHFGVRPILSRIKKSVFDILRPRLIGRRFLDLYAGTGSVGLEALSQGASYCVFVEKDPRCLKILHQNIEILKFEEAAEAVRLDVLGNLSCLGEPFPIIFMGPPYVDEGKKPLALTQPTLENIRRHRILAPHGVIVAQHHKKEPLADLPSGFSLKRREPYGDSLVDFFEEIATS
jgi:16S rRNA (guanine966-N2)-methyltransferase